MLVNNEVSINLLQNVPRLCCSSGTESYIVRTVSNTLYKIFKTDDLAILENKKEKIVRLYDKNIDFFTNPISTISYKGNFIGYEMYDENEFKTWKYTYFNRSSCINYLKLLKEKLLILEEQDIIYTDLKDDNILVDIATGRIKFCDIDNSSVDGLKSDKLLNVLKQLQLEDRDDFNIHSYMHNFFTLKELEGLERYDSLLLKHFLSNEVYLFHGFCKEGREIAKEMVKTIDDHSSFSGRYLIDHLR